MLKFAISVKGGIMLYVRFLITVLWIKWGKRDNLGIIFHITPLKHML